MCSGAIFSRNSRMVKDWIAASPAAPRNDEFEMMDCRGDYIASQ